jgi:hypothetical protein
MAKNVPRWFGPMKAARRWHELGVDSREGEALRYGVRDMPSRPVAPFRLACARTSDEDAEFVRTTIEDRLVGRIWREIPQEEALASHFLSREFVTIDTDGKRRSVSDLAHLSNHWDARPTKLDSLAGSPAVLIPGDRLLSFDLKGGYHHFRLHKDMREMFRVRVDPGGGLPERFFEFIALPFGWCMSGYWFVRIVRRLTDHLRNHLDYRVLAYLDDFLVGPSLGRAATARDCRRAFRVLDQLLHRYGLTRHPTKGVWGSGATRLEHLEFVVDTEAETFGVPERNVIRVMGRPGRCSSWRRKTEGW